MFTPLHINKESAGKSLIILLLIAFSASAFAQSEIAVIKHKRCKLMGSWRLVQTFTEGKIHNIDTTNYHSIYRLKCFSRFREEVFYDGVHWVSKGKWKVKPKRSFFLITERKYITVAPESNPQDLILNIESLEKDKFSVSGYASGQKVMMYYSRVKKR